MRLTPRITRPPEPFAGHDNSRVAGRVHALVRPRLMPDVTRSVPHSLPPTCDATRRTKTGPAGQTRPLLFSSPDPKPSAFIYAIKRPNFVIRPRDRPSDPD